MLGTTSKHILGAAITLSIAAGMADYAEAKSIPFMETGKITSIPVGHYEFCSKKPAECSTRTKGDVRVKLTKQNWETLLNVNYQANQSVEAVTDQDLYGTEEHWACLLYTSPSPRD